ALGRGVFPASEYDLGVTGGFGAEGAIGLVRDADVAVVFGAGLNQFTMRFGALFSSGTRVFQIDVAAAATHANVSGFVRADARIAAEALVERLASTVPLPRSSGRSQQNPQVSGADLLVSDESSGVAQTQWRERVDIAAARTYDAGDELAPDG